MATVHRGEIFHISGSPRVAEAAAALEHHRDGALVVDDAGTIRWCGTFSCLPHEHSNAMIMDHHGAFLLPGFIDTHMHFPQVFSGDAYGGGQLLEWLDNCIFPSESRLADPDFARVAAIEWCDRMISAGTTSGLIFGSAFPNAQDQLFETASERGLRIVCGRSIQTVGPDSAVPLLTPERDAIDLVAAEIEKWHPLDEAARASALQQVAIVPRFALSVTRETLAALGELYEAYRDRGVYFTSHLNENNRPGTGEVDSVKQAFEVDTYLDTYDGRFLPGSRVGGRSLLGPRSVMAHSVHCQDRELSRMAETGTSVSHCPASQFFLGSGTMPWKRTVGSGVNVAIGSDFGAGDEFFIPQVLNACFKAHISESGSAGLSVHPAELLFTGTLAGARALDLENRIGNFDVGKEADFVVIDPARQPSLERRLEFGLRSADADLARDALLFTVLMACREQSVAAVFVRGMQLATSS